MIPVLRSFTSLVAGIAGVPALRFGVLCLIGTVVYVAGMSSIGYAVGPAWNRVAADLSVAGYVTVAVVVVAIAAFVIYRLRELRRESTENLIPNGPADCGRGIATMTPEVENRAPLGTVSPLHVSGLLGRKLRCPPGPTGLASVCSRSARRS